MQPADIGVRIEFADVAAEAHIEHHAAANIPLNQYQSGQAEGVRERSLIVIEFGGEQRGLSVGVQEVPPRHAEHCCADTPPRNLVGIARVPRLG